MIGCRGGDADASRKLVEAFLPAIVGGRPRTSRPPSGSSDRRSSRREWPACCSPRAGMTPALKRPSGRTPRSGCASRCRSSWPSWPGRWRCRIARFEAWPCSGRARSEYVQAHGSEPTDGELSRATGADPGRRSRASRRPGNGARERLEEPLSAGSEAGGDGRGHDRRSRSPNASTSRCSTEIELHEVRDLADELGRT